MNQHHFTTSSEHGDPRIAYFDHHAPKWDSDQQDNLRILHRLGLLKERLGIAKGMHILEVGCGTGLITGWLADCAGPDQVMAIDFSEAMLNQAAKKWILAQFRKLDICTQTPPCNQFDLVLCFQSFPHFRDKASALCNLGAGLKADGRLVVLHLVGSRQINDFHRHHGNAVMHDFLPLSTEWPELLDQAGLILHSLEDREDLFLLEAVRH